MGWMTQITGMRAPGMTRPSMRTLAIASIGKAGRAALAGLGR